MRPVALPLTMLAVRLADEGTRATACAELLPCDR